MRASLLALPVLLTLAACTSPSAERSTEIEAAESNLDERAPDVFASPEALSVRISAPLSTLFARFKRGEIDPPKPVEPGTAPSPADRDFSEAGTLVFNDRGTEKSLDVRLFVRGESSRNDCPFTKLKLELTNKQQLEGTPFKGHTKMRFNTHCGPGDVSARSRMGRVFNGVGPVREELAYRIIRGAGIPTYLTRVVKVHYSDTADQSELDSFGMIMESGNDGAERFEAAGLIPAGHVYLDPSAAGRGTITPENQAQIVIAEAYAGNADWFGTHNIDSFGAPNVPAMFRIPQDFDLGAIVQADIVKYRIAQVAAAKTGLANATVAAALRDKKPAMEAALAEATRTGIAAGAIASTDGTTTTDPGFIEAKRRIDELFTYPELTTP